MFDKASRKVKYAIEYMYSYHRHLPYSIFSVIDYILLKHSMKFKESSQRYILTSIPNGLKVLIPNKDSFIRSYCATYGEIFIMKIYDKLSDFRPREEDVVLDAGAFIGLYTLKVATIVKKVYSVEPHPLSFLLLKYNCLVINKFHNVIPINVALHTIDGYITLHEDVRLVSSSSVKKISDYRSKRKTIRVSSRSLDSLYRSGLIKYPISLAKVDIEGSEYEFLKGASESLERGLIQRIIMEIHTQYVNYKNITKLLRTYGFKIVYIVNYDSNIIVYARTSR